MTPEEIRLECLKLAMQRHGANDRRPLLEIADEFAGWVMKNPAAKRKAPGKVEEKASVR